MPLTLYAILQHAFWSAEGFGKREKRRNGSKQRVTSINGMIDTLIIFFNIDACEKQLEHLDFPHARHIKDVIMSTSKLRLRHPKGVSTLELDLDSATVQDLLNQVQKFTEILPSQQDCKLLTKLASILS